MRTSAATVATTPGNETSAIAAIPVKSPALSLRIAVGLAGVLLAVLVAGLNENVTKAALADIRGAMGIGHDEGSWLVSVYAASSVSAMAFAPWFAATFSLRRFTLVMLAAFALLGALCPLAPDVSTLLVLRTLQGLAGGALPPMLMSVALRFLPPNIKLYGLAAYALTATFGPGLGTPLAALWTEYVSWRWTFWQIVVPTLLAMGAVAWGLPQDPLRLERFRQFDWRGLLLGLPAICLLVIVLTQGERLDWFVSPQITTMTAAALVLGTLFMVNEWFHPLPFFRLQLLAHRNLTFSLLTLGGVLFILLAVSLIPSAYLAQVQGYRPLQTTPMMLLVALPQLLALPLVAALCNLRVIDCRWVLASGLGMLALACWLGTQMTSVWIRDNFYLLQALQIFAQPMSVIPLLMLATTGLMPQDGPFASAWFNTVKGFSVVLAGGVLEAMITVRNHFHSTMLVDRLGNLFGADGGTALSARLHKQVVVLTSIDLYRGMVWLALALVLLIPVVATRIYPPRAA
jgi:DHA2 family multidrug resistance protein